MKISAQEEYGIRCLLQLGGRGAGASLTIPEIGRAEGLSAHYAAKLMRILRDRGFVKSARGQAGGYTLARPLGEIRVGEVLAALGGRLYQPSFCQDHAGIADRCPHAAGCSLRELWQGVQDAVDQVLAQTTLAELVATKPPGKPWVPAKSAKVSPRARSRTRHALGIFA